MLETSKTKEIEVKGLSLVSRMRKGTKYQSISSNKGKKNLSHMKRFKCQQNECYDNQCLMMTNRNSKHKKPFLGRMNIVVGFDRLESNIDTTFSMVFYLSTNIVSDIRWYVDSGILRHLTFFLKK